MKLFTFDMEMEGTSKYHIAVSGLRGCRMNDDLERLLARIKELGERQGVLAVQLFDADRIATHLHLVVSAIYAIRAFKFARNISNTLGTEALLYASAQRQISEAISKVGIRPGSRNLAILVIALLSDPAIKLIGRLGMELGGLTDDSVLTVVERQKVIDVRNAFEVGDEELEASELGTSPIDIESALTRRILSRISIMIISK